MIPNEVTQGFMRRVQNVADVLSLLKGDMEKLSASAEKTAAEAGVNGAAIAILARELRHFTAKTDAMSRDAVRMAGEGSSVYEISENVFKFMKAIDDLAFQMNLLRFLSGVEVARTGNKDPFTVFQNNFALLTDGFQKNYIASVDLLKELLVLLKTHIRKESAVYVKNAADMAAQTARFGADLAENTKITAAGAVRHGAGFIYIAGELEKQAGRISEAATVIGKYSADLEKTDLCDLPASERAAVGRAVDSLLDISLSSNLTAFHACIEAARAGNGKELDDWVNKMMNYPVLIQQAHASCAELLGESNKLSVLPAENGEKQPEYMPQRLSKVIDDIIFQGRLLTMQLGMESARWGKDIMINHTAAAEDALTLLIKEWNGETGQDTGALQRYANTVTALNGYLRADADANMPYGLTFAYIAREFDTFIEKLNKVIDRLNP